MWLVFSRRVLPLKLKHVVLTQLCGSYRTPFKAPKSRGPLCHLSTYPAPSWGPGKDTHPGHSCCLHPGQRSVPEDWPFLSSDKGVLGTSPGLLLCLRITSHPDTPPITASGPVTLHQWDCIIFLKITFFLKIYLFWAVLGLHWCAWAFSSCSERGVGATLHYGAWASHCSGFFWCKAWAWELNNCTEQAQVPRGTWNLLRPGIKPMFPALAGRFLTIGPTREVLGFSF